VPKLYLVRHGKPLARFDQDHDPGLDEVGHEQAHAAALDLRHLAPLAVMTSPLRRARETAAAFERRFHVSAAVEPAVGEVKSPTDDLAERMAWLVDILRRERRWAELDEERRRWRDGVIAALLAVTSDSVVTTHYIAINAAVGTATGDDRVVSFRPDFCSITELDSDGLSL
jgi:broad specificity phosphatase PhoE